MQTQCPNCDTRFRVTDSQLNIAEGMVRCGICEQVFNVYETDDHALHDQHTQEPADNKLATEKIGTQDPPSDEEGAELNGKETFDDDSPNPHASDNITDDEEIHPDQYLTETEEATSVTDIESLTEQATEDIDKDFNSDDNQKDTYNFFEDDGDDTTSYVVPREFHESHLPDSPSAFSTALWGIGTLLLIATLFVEYAWFNRNDFTHVPEIQAEIDSLCQHLDCTNLSLRSPSKIELVTRNIYTHPNAKEALMVNVTMKNNAAYSQPYPRMKIDFTDIRGNIIASRNFLPQEYLYAQYQQDEDQSLPPDSSSDITLEIQDPGIQALTYEFSFL